MNLRIARCAYYGTTPSGVNHSSYPGGCKRGQPCLCEKPSGDAYSGKLAFFRERPDRDHDEFYCGCWGWE